MDTGTANTNVKLPEHCLSRDRVSGRTVTLIRGKLGSAPAVSKEAPEVYNHRIGLTYEQVDALEYGSALGFDMPLADPEYVRKVRAELGQPIGPLDPPVVKGAAPSSVMALPASKQSAPARRSVLEDIPSIDLLPEFKAA